MSDINIFRDPPTQAEIDGALRADRNRLTTGEKIALGPGVLGFEVLVGAAVDAFSGEQNFMTGKTSQWEEQPGAVGWDWSKSIFAESYVKKVRAMNRELVRGEVTALTRQFNMEEKTIDAVKDAGKVVGNIAEALISSVAGKR
ncbi:hypothetical protein A8H39_00715 [Paraburkholderia fungorum]|uniref:hypothetical protein n=1 Tax=Paraburkholderia fungorum TaxID=134537 RepID=UPI0005A7D718|nr:hypothetical protein [Paraburkholderia fungorum]PNE59702.1 hypothetical protein A8H39_00715 [Paraburkholderia fungorum]